MIYNKIVRSGVLTALVAILAGLIVTSCDDGKSYAELLTEEEKAVNWYLAQQKVVPYVPEDSVFEVGKDAPYYRMDKDGNVYMRVINPGDMENRPEKGDVIYFRFMRTNIKYILEYGDGAGSEGNADNMDSSFSGANLIYGNTTITSTTQYGTGIQVPLGYLGYNCEVDLIVKSTEGMTGDISNCNPYVYRGLKFYKAEY